MNENISIGYFGIPGGVGGLTHLSDGKIALCGIRFHPKSVYQWCTPLWRDGEPECVRCKNIRLKWLIALNEDKPMKKCPTANVHFSSATNEWATPPELFARLDAAYHFTLDPCCTQGTRLCRKYYTKQDDGLAQDWSKDVVFMNPPYGREIGKWMKKAYDESRRGATVVCLIPARVDTRWYYDYCIKSSEIIFITGRIKFMENGITLKSSAPFPSCIVVFSPMTSSPKIRWKKLTDL